jgi:hypothetical protein
MNPQAELNPKILEDKQESAARPWLNASASLVVAVAFAIFAARLFRLISKYAVNIFFSDQWEFNDATLFQKHTIWQMFAWQHGPHRQGFSLCSRSWLSRILVGTAEQSRSLLEVSLSRLPPVRCG